MSRSTLPIVAGGGAAAGLLLGLVGYLLGRDRGSRELVATYRNMATYGRPDEPKATVRPAPPSPEQRVTAEISETAIVNLTDHLAKEAGVSSTRAREEAERLMSHFETTGTLPT